MILYPDPLAEALRILRAHPLPEVAEMHFGTESPDSLGDDLPGLPYVGLELIPGEASPFRFVPTINIRAWAATKADTLRAVSLARAVLLDFPGDDRVRSVYTGSTPLVTDDPDTGQPIASTTVRLRLGALVP